MSGAQRLATLAQELGITIAVAESLTCGALSAEVGKGDDASTWFAGSLVAYQTQVKARLLGVSDGPVVSAECAQQMALAAREMAEGVKRLLSADASVAATGVGGPGPEEGRSAGTVYIACCVQDHTIVTQHEFTGEPSSVIEQTAATAIDRLIAVLTELHVAPSA